MKMRITTAFTAILWALSEIAAIAGHPADSLKQLLPLSKSDTNKVWLLRDIAYYMRAGYPDSAIYYSRRGAALARFIHFPEGQIRNLYQTALAYEDKEQLDSAIYIYGQAILMAHDEGLGKTKVDMLNAKGVAYYYAGNLAAAVRQYAMAYAAADSLNYKDQMGHALNNMGVIYRMQGRYDKALEVYRKSLVLKETHGDTSGVVNALYNMGLAYSYTEHFKESLGALLRARKLARYMEGKEVDMAPIDVGVGVAFYNLDQVDSARQYLAAGLAKLGSAEPFTRAAGMAYLGAIHVADGRHAAGMEMIDEAYAYAKNAGRLELLLQIARQRAMAAEMVGDQALAARSWHNYSVMADSLRSRDIRGLREEMQARFELKDKEITIAGQEWQIQQELLRSRRMRIAAAVLLLLAVGCGALAVQLRRRAAQLNLAVDEKERALQRNELLLKEMHHRTKNNLQLLHSVFNLHRRATANEDAREVLKAGGESVEAIGLLHHHLYRSNDFRKVNIRPFLIDLVTFFSSAFALEERGIDFRLKCPDLEIDIDVAVPLGIVINELSTNALKHAFEHVEAPLMELELTLKNKRMVIRLSDNGCGISGTSHHPGTGSRLIDLFGKKLGAEITRRSDDSGTQVHMEFEMPEKP